MSEPENTQPSIAKYAKPHFAVDGPDGRKKLVISFKGHNSQDHQNPFPFLDTLAKSASTALDIATDSPRRPDFIGPDYTVRVTLDMKAPEIAAFASAFTKNFTLDASEHPPFDKQHYAEKYARDFDAALSGALKNAGFGAIASDVEKKNRAVAQIG